VPQQNAVELADLLNLHVIRGPFDGDRAWAYFRKFSEFESWILDGEPPADSRGREVPPEHDMMLSYWPEAFEVYRESMWAYLERELKINPWIATLRSLLERGRAIDPGGCEAFIEEARGGVDRYWQQRRNADQRGRHLKDRPLDKRYVRDLLSAYSEYYEIDFGLWVLGSLAKCFSDGRFTPRAFGGPSTGVAQGSLVDAVVLAANGTPLGALILSAYDASLRNAIGHNDYSIALDGGELTVTDSRSGTVWTSDDIYSMIFNTSQFLEAVHSVIAFEHEVAGVSLESYKDSGTVSAAYFILSTGEPMVVLFQLWCFHRIDPLGKWLDAAEMSIEKGAAHEEIIRFTASAWTKGEKVSEGLVGDALREGGWVRVLRVPVAPDLGLGYPSFTRPDGASYCIVGESDVHVLPYSGIRDHVGAWPR